MQEAAGKCSASNLSGESNGVAMIDERMASETETSTGKRNNNQAVRNFGYKAKKRTYKNNIGIKI